MLAGGNGGVILNFVSVGRLQQIPLIISTTCESTAHVYSRSGVEDSFGATGANILKAGFINGAFVKCFRVADLQSVLGVELIEALRGQAELTDAIIDFIFPEVLIARSERVAGRELIVDARRQVGAGSRIGNSVREPNRVKICIECRSAYD